MQINFRYQKAEVINALRFHFLNRAEIRLFRIALFVLLGIAVLGYFLHMVSLPVVVAIALMLAVLLLAFWYLLPLSIYRKAATFKEFIRLQYNEDGVTIGTHVGERSLSWRSFNSVVETATFHYLYRDKKSFFLVPAQAFRDEAERGDFSRLLRSKFDDYIKK
ncbi:YcxB family protein [Compostibacter hankyongensis]|uniref:YcxB-like C-terminal domain-containing protein n=1 Tax=Compostibacter hankyongensis TaxID=1007089 RepID=A0ABP8FIJ5_9BACT